MPIVVPGDEQEVADPLEAPPAPFRVGQDPARFRYTHPTPPRAAFRPYLDDNAPMDPPAPERSSGGPLDPVPRPRSSAPPAIPEGEFNPGVAIAWSVALGMSGVVFLWYAGAGMLAGL